MRRVLILSCSQRKRSDLGSLPAIERYDGPPFRVLRRYLRTRPIDPPEVYILSAEFGLIPADYPIPDYDHRMTVSRARQLQDSVGSLLKAIFENADVAGDQRRVFLNLGKTYQEALNGYREPFASVLVAQAAFGGMGKRLSQLKSWLYNDERGLQPILIPISLSRYDCVFTRAGDLK